MLSARWPLRERNITPPKDQVQSTQLGPDRSCCLSKVLNSLGLGTDLLQDQPSYFILGVSVSNSPSYFEHHFPPLPLSRLISQRQPWPPPPASRKMICQAAFLKGKVICWNLSQTISRIEPPKVIGHVFRKQMHCIQHSNYICSQHFTVNFLLG